MKKIFPSYLVLILISSLFYLLNQKLVEQGMLSHNERVLFNSYSLVGIVESFLVFCLILPLLEEFSFRSVLSKNTKAVTFGVSFFLVFLFFKILENYYTINLWLDLLLCFLIGFIFYFVLNKINFELKFLNSNLIITSFLFSGFFAIFHLGINYTSESILYLIISVLPFFLSGLVFSRLRIKFGLVYSIVLHSLINFTGWLLSFL